MNSPVRRVSAYGFFGIGNFGNEGSLLALVTHLRVTNPDTELSCLSADPDEVLAEHGLPGTTLMANPSLRDAPLSGLRKLIGRLQDIPRTFRLAGRADVVVVPGMGVFEETLGTRPWGLPYWLLLVAVSCRVRRKGIAFVSVGAERALNPLTRALFRWTLRLATYRSYRDELSRAAVQSMGVRTSAADVVPDLAFALPAPPVVDVRPGHLAVGVMTYYGRHDDPVRGAETRRTYIAAMTDFLVRQTDSGRTVTLVLGDRVDLGVAVQIRDGVLRSRPGLRPDAVALSQASTLAEIMSVMSEAEAVVGSRFHNVFCALRVAKPTVSIAYAPKNTALMTEFGLGAFCQSIDSLDVNLLCAQLDEVIREHPENEPHMHATNARYAAELDAQFDRLSRTVLHAEPVHQVVTA